MYKEAFIQKLKQNNVSKDIEKTKQRMEAIWKSASKDERDTIMSLAGVALSTIQRVYKTGSISAKLIVPISQTLDINPLYLTGKSDEDNGCTDELLKDFLIDCGYRDLLLSLPPERKKRGRTAQAAQLYVEEAEAEIEPTPVEVLEDFEETAEPAPEFLDCMTEEDMILLLRAVLLRAKAGGKGAELANKLKALLLGLE